MASLGVLRLSPSFTRLPALEGKYHPRTEILSNCRGEIMY
jgi:hypothetical protein